MPRPLSVADKARRKAIAKPHPSRDSWPKGLTSYEILPTAELAQLAVKHNFVSLPNQTMRQSVHSLVLRVAFKMPLSRAHAQFLHAANLLAHGRFTVGANVLSQRGIRLGEAFAREQENHIATSLNRAVDTPVGYNPSAANDYITVAGDKRPLILRSPITSSSSSSSTSTPTREVEPADRLAKLNSLPSLTSEDTDSGYEKLRAKLREKRSGRSTSI